MSQTDDFWDSPKPHSIKKSKIVADYIIPWASIVGSRVDELHYLDLFSGRGVYKDGSPSTPIYVLDKLFKSPDIAKRMHMTFCEEDEELRNVLTDIVRKHPVYSMLASEPKILPDKISPSYAECLIGRMVDGTFTFIDPYGYREISIELLDVVTSKWGCDSLSYLSISGLVRNLKQIGTRPKLEAFFGQVEFHELLDRVNSMDEKADREELVYSTIIDVLNKRRNYLRLEYKVELDRSRRASHYLLFLSKGTKGTEKMLDVMARHGISDDHGIPSLVYSPRLWTESQQVTMGFAPRDRLIPLAQEVMKDFGGLTISVGSLLTKCQLLSYQYRASDIRQALNYLINDGNVNIVKFSSKQSITRLFKDVILRFDRCKD